MRIPKEAIMALQTINVPAHPNAAPPTRDTTPEGGDSWFDFITKAKAMFAELYGVNTEYVATLIDFGAFPGASNVSLDITGQTGIVAGSLVEAWIIYAATVDHSADEHLVDPPRVIAGNIVPGVGFTIYAVTADLQLAYGKWSVGWRWQ
jgi:hypothetical protein